MDVDGDGTVDGNDVQYMLDYIVGSIDVFPIG